jgi:hypothetical protein
MNMSFKKNLQEYYFYYFLIIITLVAGVSSYFRFIVKHDYVLYYEGECDPTIERCFVGCEDDTCTKEYYYSKVQKYAPDLYNQCGDDITDCTEANICLPSDSNCSVLFCNPEIDSDNCTKSIPGSIINSSLDTNLLLEESNIE